MRRWVGIGGTFLFVGCQTSRPAAPPSTPAPPLAVAPAASPNAVQQVRYTEPAGTTALTLDAAIAACLQADPRLRGGYEMIAQANADLLRASTPPNPEMFIDGQLLPLTRPFTPERPGGPTQVDLQFLYGIDWFVFGKRAAAVASAQLGVRVSESEYADRVRQRVTETALAYYDVVEAKALVDLARQDVENSEKVESLVQKSVQAGFLSGVDLSRIRLDLLAHRRSLRDAEASLAGAKARLRARLGRSDGDANFEVAGMTAGVVPIDPLPADQAFAVAIDHRPDLAALRWRLAQAQADVEVERRRAYPKVEPLVGWTKQYQRSIGFSDSDTYAVGLTVGLPIVDRNQGGRARAASEAVQSGCELAAGEVELRAELEAVIADLRASRANADAVTQEQLGLAASVRDKITEAYRAGERPLLDVLDAQRNYHETYRQFVTSRANYWRALARYQSALGQQVTPQTATRPASLPEPSQP